MRWLDRVSYHLWRIAVNFSGAAEEAAAEIEEDAVA